MRIQHDNRGVAIIIVLVVSATLIGVAVGISSIVIRELRVSTALDESTSAIIAADAAMERKLYDIRKTGGEIETRYDEIELPNGAFFSACTPRLECTASSTAPNIVKTRGRFGETTRALQTSF